MEERTELFRRIPPGDRWAYATDLKEVGLGMLPKRIYPSITAAIEDAFQQTGCKQFFLDAGAGKIFSETSNSEPPIKKFSIYGDY